MSIVEMCWKSNMSMVQIIGNCLLGFDFVFVMDPNHSNYKIFTT